MAETVGNPVARDAAGGGGAAAGGGGLDVEEDGYAATVRERCKPCGIWPPCSRAGLHDDEGDLRFIDARPLRRGDPEFEQGKTYQDLAVPQLCLLALQHYLAVVASVTGLAGVMARMGQCKGTNRPGGGACYIDDLETMQDLVMWTVIISGVCTMLQCMYTGQFSSNVLSIMGTSSAFISVVGITGKMAAPGDGVALVMRMSALTFWIEPFFIYFLPKSFIDNKLLDPTVKESVVITIGLTLTARVGTKSWIGDGHASDAVLGLACVVLLTALTRLNEMKNADGTRRNPEWLMGIPLGRFALVLSLLGGWALKSLAGGMLTVNDLPSMAECPNLCSTVADFAKEGDREGPDQYGDCVEACTSLGSCVTPTRPDGYDFSNIVDDTVSRARDAFNVTGIRCADEYGRPVDREESSLLESILGTPACQRCQGVSGACACPCTYGGDSFSLIGCEANEAEQHFMFPAFSIPRNVDTSSYPNGIYPTSALLIPWLITRIASSLESIGDITATVAESGKVTEGPKFQQRLRGGLTMDAVSGLLGAFVGGLPLTTLSQNNGLIKQAGWHDYRGGVLAGVLLLLTGIVIGQVPAEVALASAGNSRLAACLTVIFATIAVGGFERLFKFSPQDLQNLRNLDAELARRRFIAAAAVGVGLGSEMHAYGLNHRATFLAKDFSEVQALANFHQDHLMEPDFNVAEQFFVQQTLSIIFASGVASTTLAALLLNFVWPKELLGDDEKRTEDTANVPTGAAAVATGFVLECVNVHKWLVDQGFSGQAETILKSLAEADIPVEEWLGELQSMSAHELDDLIAVTDAHIRAARPNDDNGAPPASVANVSMPSERTAVDSTEINTSDGRSIADDSEMTEAHDEEAAAVVPGADFIAARRAAKQGQVAVLPAAMVPAPNEELGGHTDDI
eukprot:COSAG02_NODE_63_length_43286_cov_54.666412_5_plen_910_part_00